MVITGQITYVSAPMGGTSKAGKPWQKIDFIVEYLPGNYPKAICFSTMDTAMFDQLKVGLTVSVTYDVVTREYNGKWYNDFRIWKDGIKITPAQPQQPQPAYTPQPAPAPQSAYTPAPQAAPQPTPTQPDDNDLPF